MKSVLSTDNPAIITGQSMRHTPSVLGIWTKSVRSCDPEPQRFLGASESRTSEASRNCLKKRVVCWHLYIVLSVNKDWFIIRYINILDWNNTLKHRETWFLAGIGMRGRACVRMYGRSYMGVRAGVRGKTGTWIIHSGTRKITVCSSTFYSVNTVLLPTQ